MCLEYLNRLLLYFCTFYCLSFAVGGRELSHLFPSPLSEPRRTDRHQSESVRFPILALYEMFRPKHAVPFLTQQNFFRPAAHLFFKKSISHTAPTPTPTRSNYLIALQSKKETAATDHHVPHPFCHMSERSTDEDHDFFSFVVSPFLPAPALVTNSESYDQTPNTKSGEVGDN